MRGSGDDKKKPNKLNESDALGTAQANNCNGGGRNGSNSPRPAEKSKQSQEDEELSLMKIVAARSATLGSNDVSSMESPKRSVAGKEEELMKVADKNVKLKKAPGAEGVNASSTAVPAKTAAARGTTPTRANDAVSSKVAPKRSLVGKEGSKQVSELDLMKLVEARNMLIDENGRSTEGTRPSLAAREMSARVASNYALDASATDHQAEDGEEAASSGGETTLRRGTAISPKRGAGAYRTAPGASLRRMGTPQFAALGPAIRPQPSSRDIEAGVPATTPEESASAALAEESSNLELNGDDSAALVEAMPVVEESTRNIQGEAHQLDLEIQRKKRKKWNTQKKLYLGLMALMVCIFVVVGASLGSFLGSKSSTNNNTIHDGLADHNSTIDNSTSNEPTIELGNLQELYESLPASTKDSLYDPDTPQSQAWEWLLTHQNITNLPGWRKEQLFAMATFYYSMQGPLWPRPVSMNWLNDTQHECSWINTSVTKLMGLSIQILKNGNIDYRSCNDEGQLQTIAMFSLDLAGANPGPIMPSEISLLTSLAVLSLPFSNIQAPLSKVLTPELAQLPNLKIVNLHANQLSKTIPPYIQEMTALKHLLLGQNLLTGTIPKEVSKMTNLQLLHLLRNQLTGSIHTQMGLLTQMTNLDIFINELTGTLPSQLGLLSSMDTLTLYTNGITGTIPTQLGLLTNMAWFLLRHNSLSGPIPSQLGSLTRMTDLGLNNNGLTSTIPTQLGHLSSTLLALSVSENALSGSLPSELGQLTNLVSLDLHQNNFVGSIPDQFWGQQQLRQLDFSNLPLLSGTVPPEFCSLQDLQEQKNGTTCEFDVPWANNNGQTTSPCKLEFDCTELLCGCDCECANQTFF